jgi:hypothetical protein
MSKINPAYISAAIASEIAKTRELKTTTDETLYRSILENFFKHGVAQFTKIAYTSGDPVYEHYCFFIERLEKYIIPSIFSQIPEHERPKYSDKPLLEQIRLLGLNTDLNPGLILGHFNYVKYIIKPHAAKLLGLLVGKFDFNIAQPLPYADFGNTLLHFFIAYEYPDRAISVLKSLPHLNTEAMDALGQTILLLACRLVNPHQEQLIEQILRFNPSLKPDNHGNNPLHYIAQFGLERIFVIFQRHFPKWNLQAALLQPNKEGKTPVEIIDELNSMSTVEASELLTQRFHAIEIDPKRSTEASRSHYKHQETMLFVNAAAKLKPIVTGTYSFIITCECCQGAAPGDYSVLNHPTGGFENLASLVAYQQSHDELIFSLNTDPISKRKPFRGPELDDFFASVSSLAAKTVLDSSLEGIPVVYAAIAALAPAAEKAVTVTDHTTLFAATKAKATATATAQPQAGPNSTPKDPALR